jgi:hypothetical protein
MALDTGSVSSTLSDGNGAPHRLREIHGRSEILAAWVYRRAHIV